MSERQIVSSKLRFLHNLCLVTDFTRGQLQGPYFEELFLKGKLSYMNLSKIFGGNQSQGLGNLNQRPIPEPLALTLLFVRVGPSSF